MHLCKPLDFVMTTSQVAFAIQNAKTWLVKKVSHPEGSWLKRLKAVFHLHKIPFVQAVGMINDHVVDCFRYTDCKDLARL